MPYEITDDYYNSIHDDEYDEDIRDDEFWNKLVKAYQGDLNG